MEQQQAIVNPMLDMGEALLDCGAEVHRVEDTLTRIAKAYGVQDINVFVITSNITLTMGFSEDGYVTQTRRIIKQGSPDFTKLEQLNALSRSCCEHPMPAGELTRRLHEIMSRQNSLPRTMWGGCLAASSFAVFFSGSIADGILAGLVSFLILYLQKKWAPFCMNTMIFNLSAAFLTGLAVYLLSCVVPDTQLDKIMMGDIMLLIPGVSMTNAVRDIMLGDTISGSMRLLETLLWAAALASGFIAALWLMGGIGL